MLCQFSIYPLGGSAHFGHDIRKMSHTLDDMGVKHMVGPLGTSVEGSWDEIMDAVQTCHQLALETHDRVVTTITIDQRRQGTQTLDQSVNFEKVEVEKRDELHQAGATTLNAPVAEAREKWIRHREL